MKFYVKEHNWMWSNLKLSLAECRVYAYIYGLSHGDKGGYDGSKRALAKSLGLNEKSVRNILDTLKEKSLISCTNGIWMSENRTIDQSAESVRRGAESVRENADSVRENADSVPSPHTPLLYNNIKNNASMQTDFDLFWKYFSVNMPTEFQNRKEATRKLFESRSEVAQKALVEAAQEGAPGHPGDDPNPYFYVEDFLEPQPTFLRGDEGGDIVQVLYNGKFKLCTRATMELFGLQWVRDW